MRPKPPNLEAAEVSGDHPSSFAAIWIYHFEGRGRHVPHLFTSGEEKLLQPLSNGSASTLPFWWKGVSWEVFLLRRLLLICRTFQLASHGFDFVACCIQQPLFLSRSQHHHWNSKLYFVTGSGQGSCHLLAATQVSALLMSSPCLCSLLWGSHEHKKLGPGIKSLTSLNSKDSLTSNIY